jgi:hypothetical protein
MRARRLDRFRATKITFAWRPASFFFPVRWQRSYLPEFATTTLDDVPMRAAPPSR